MARTFRDGTLDESLRDGHNTDHSVEQTIRQGNLSRRTN
jgi:hypothetical protein